MRGRGRAPATMVTLVVALGSGAVGCGRDDGAARGGAGEAPGDAVEAPATTGASSERTPDRYDFGRAPTPAEIEAVDVDVLPDGTGLPAGSGSVAEGERIFRTRCASCHGPGGNGGAFAPLVAAPGERRFPSSTGPRVPFTVGNYWPYATSLYEYVARAMPMQDPGTLEPAEVYAVVTWILHRNGILEADAVLDAETLPGVEMPARDRFVRDERTGGPRIR